jgi:uncharacterized MnhB-related membrane protein
MDKEDIFLYIIVAVTVISCIVVIVGIITMSNEVLTVGVFGLLFALFFGLLATT